MAPRRSLDHVVVVVPEADRRSGAELARTLAAAGAAVVCAGVDPAAVGALARELADGGARTVAFVTGAATGVGHEDAPSDGDALVELVAELFPHPGAPPGT